MTSDDDESFKARLKRAETKRQDAERKQDKVQERYRSISGAGLAMRFATEFFASVVVGAGIGILLDRWLETSPLFLLLMFGFGVAAGVLGGIRAYRAFNAGLAAQEAAKIDTQDNGIDTP